MMKTRQLAGSNRARIGQLMCAGFVLFAQATVADVISFGGPYSRFDDLFIVSTGADNVGNCNNLLTTLAAVSGVATVRLPPAVYDCQTSVVPVPQGVTLEGSSQQNTNIVGQGELNVSTWTDAVVRTSIGSALYDLTVENTATNGLNIVAVEAECDSVLTHVTAISMGSGNYSNVGVLINGPCSQPGATWHEITAQTAGANTANVGMLAYASVLIENSKVVSSSVGVHVATNTSLTIRESVIYGVEWGAEAVTSGELSLQHSSLSGSIRGDGTFTCFSVTDDSNNELDSSCLPMPE